MKRISARKAFISQYDWHVYSNHSGKKIESKKNSDGIVFRVGKKEFTSLNDAKLFIESK